MNRRSFVKKLGLGSIVPLLLGFVNLPAKQAAKPSMSSIKSSDWDVTVWGLDEDIKFHIDCKCDNCGYLTLITCPADGRPVKSPFCCPICGSYCWLITNVVSSAAIVLGK